MNSNQTRVTLEDLLRVKRAEQPPESFWSDFDREMRAKQLAAIVEPRPWWAPFIRVGSRVSHYHVPLGAAAALALSFVTISEYRTPSVRPVAQPELAVSTPTTALNAALREAVHAESAETVAQAAPVQIEELTSVPQEDQQLAYAPETLDDVGAVAESSGDVMDNFEPSPSARYIAANLAAAQAADPSLMDEVFGSSVRSVETRRQVRDPLVQIASPGDTRRSRLMEPALPAAAGADVMVGNSDRVARRLTEERMYDTIRRIGLQGDRVAIKF